MRAAPPVRTSDKAAHFDVADAVIHADEWHTPQLRQCARHDAAHSQRRAHAGSTRIGDAHQRARRNTGDAQRIVHQL